MKFVLSLALLVYLATPLAAQPPATIPDQAVTQIDDVGYYEPGYQLRGGPEVDLAIGETYGLDSPTGASCQAAAPQNGKRTWLMQPPWRAGTGVAFQDFRFALPASSTRVLLTGFTALQPPGVGKSDGATFRIFIDGVKRFEVNRADSGWQPFSIDLGAFAGKTVTVRFETDPGPHDDPSFDFAVWGDRRLAITGLSSASHPVQPGPAIDLRKLSSTQNGSVAPLSAFAGKHSIEKVGNAAIFTYSGPDGTLKYIWSPGVSPDSPLGSVTLESQEAHGDTHRIPLASATQIHWTAPAVLASSKLSASPNGALLTSTYTVHAETATLRIASAIIGKSLVFTLDCDKPLIADMAGGTWGPVMTRREIDFPYYSNPLFFLSRENLFAGAFLDWTQSHSSGIEGLQATYGAKTDGTRNPLHERLVYTAAWTLDETLPNIPNPPSPYRARLGKGIILDVWGGPFADIQSRLHGLASTGIGPATAIVHDWQHAGYDNALPAVVPARDELGGDAGMKSLVAEAQKDGFDIALHENYVDYYPNYSGFTDADIAKASDGSRINAWYNPGTKIQSFAEKPTRILSLAGQWSPQVEQLYAPADCYLDVHSAVPPWFHVDFDASQPGAASFQTARAAHTALWAYERRLHHGPVFGEGLNHWYWSGLLDGVEAQFGVGWPQNAGLTAPLLVDFDLLKIHPLQLNHGMGYYNRWSPGDPNADLIHQLDIYRMQEVAYGHEGFLTSPNWSNPALAFEEARLLPIVTSHTSTADVVAIDYENGGHWRNVSDTIRYGGDFSRVRVLYSNGITIWANSSAGPMQAGGFTLPSNGWLAKGDGIAAGTVQRTGRIIDFAQSAASVYLNARPNSWRAAASGITPVEPKVESFQETGPRSFRVTYHWRIGWKVHGDYTSFVHFTDPKTDSIVFQQDHKIATPTTQWKPGVDIADGSWDINVPANIAPGDYNWLIGLFNTSGRLLIQGDQAGDSRILLGILHVGADSVGFTPASSPATDRVSPEADMEAAIGPVKTNGCIDIRRAGSDWVLSPISASGNLTFALDPRFFGSPAEVETEAGPVPVKKEGGMWTFALNGSPAYRWPVAR
jgi:hypothetical protein